jgi:hypothetical protein
MATPVNTIKLKYEPRSWFKSFHSRRHRKAVLVAHRRCGKTVAAVNDLVSKALRFKHPTFKRPNYAYICPELKQAKLVAWEYLKEAVREIPGCKISESELYVKLPNEARIRLYGADNPDSMRGMYFDGVILDEFGDMKATLVAQVILPALSDREGWIVYMGTPKGKNDFYDKHKQASENDKDDWFYLCLKASQTKLLPQYVLDEAQIDLGDDLFEQEYECSFEAANIGTYFGKHMQAIEQQGKVRTPVDYDAKEKVYIAMDLGHRDACAIWFWQVIKGDVVFFDYFEETGYDAEEVCEMLQLKPYNYDTWFIPHDAVHRTFATKKSVLDTFRAYDAPCRVVPKLDLHDQIDSVRKTLRTYPLVFDSVRCKRGIEALKNYSRKWDMDKKIFSDTPSHDQWSHGADAFRYACLSIKPEDLGRSIERAAQRITTAATDPYRINIGATAAVSAWTIDNAFKEREAKARSIALSGPKRI